MRGDRITAERVMAQRVRGLRVGLPPVVGGAPSAYATWNPADMAADYALSLGDLRVTRTGADGWSAVRANMGKSAGKWYWELTGSPTVYHVIGVMDGSGTLANFVGGDTHGVGYYAQTGQKTYNGALTAFADGYSNETMGLALDAAARTLRLYKANVLQGVIDFSALGLTGAVYPAYSGYQNGVYMTANFGASPFVYSPPAGYNAGVYV